MGGIPENIDVRRARDGEEFVLRPWGYGRFAIAAFLAFWLCGWAGGEAFALSVVLAPLAPALRGLWPGWSSWPPDSLASLPFVLLIALWLAFWTWGGLAALWVLLRLLFGRDRILVGPAGLELRAGVGPFGRTRRIPRRQIETVTIRRRGGALVARGAAGDAVLTTGVKPADRPWLRDRIRVGLGMGEERLDPAGAAQASLGEWAVRRLDGGGARLVAAPGSVRRSVGCAWTLALPLLAAAGWLTVQAAPSLGVLRVIAVLAAAGATGLAAYLTLAREEWEAAPGRVVRLRRWGGLVRRTEVQARQLSITHESDSDGDDWFELTALGTPRPLRVMRAMNHPSVVVGLGQFLARHAEVPIEIAPEALEPEKVS